MGGTYPTFNLALWGKQIPQDLITLNLLHKSNMSPSLSTYSQLYGTYDFNFTSIASLVVRVMVHEKPDDRQTWAPHEVEVWYICLAMYYYRWYKVWINVTRAEMITDTIA